MHPRRIANETRRKSRLLFGACSLLVCSCSKARERDTALVFAASSLTSAFTELKSAFERGHPGAVIDLSFAGTPQLAAQIQEGAAADMLAAADEVSVQKLVAAGLTSGAAQVFARNRLTIVTASGNPKHVRGLADLARTDLKVLLCAPAVPAGRYAREALSKAQVMVAPASEEQSVKAVIGKIALGEADAGIVYVTDLLDARGNVAGVAIPAVHNVVATYPLALLENGRSAAVARAFAEFVLSPHGQRVLLARGFVVP